MVNRLYNKQVSPKGFMKGGRAKKMGSGMMMKKDAVDKPMMKKGGKIPPQLKKFVMAKKKNPK